VWSAVQGGFEPDVLKNRQGSAFPSLKRVVGDPSRFATIALAFHASTTRLSDWPGGFLRDGDSRHDAAMTLGSPYHVHLRLTD